MFSSKKHSQKKSQTNHTALSWERRGKKKNLLFLRWWQYVLRDKECADFIKTSHHFTSFTSHFFCLSYLSSSALYLVTGLLKAQFFKKFRKKSHNPQNKFPTSQSPNGKVRKWVLWEQYFILFIGFFLFLHAGVNGASAREGWNAPEPPSHLWISHLRFLPSHTVRSHTSLFPSTRWQKSWRVFKIFIGSHPDACERKCVRF